MVTNNHFNIYLAKVFELAQTIVIKSDIMARQVNALLLKKYSNVVIDPSRPEEWKYYLNICGEYHPSDEINGKMKVISLDTLEEIEFTKENLKVHRATARAYQYGTRLYKELRIKYPHHENLIKGILYPADMQTAINAPDGTILSYPTKLVEVNEYSFIIKLQDWIFKYKRQFQNPQYRVSDELFEYVVFAQLYANLVPAILNIRLAACRTNEAHSYHVRRYLASHGFLDEYMDHLTLYQSLWFYRNINYIERHAAHKDTFDWLIENVFTHREIPVGEYNMTHDTSKQPNGVSEFHPQTVDWKDILYPEIMFDKRDLNDVPSIAKIRDTSIEDIFKKEDRLAKDNPVYHQDELEIARNKLENSLTNKLNTKVLESSMYDYTDSEPYKLTDILLNQWIHRAHNGSYRAAIVVINPLTNENIPLTALEALWLLYYCYHAQDEKYPQHVPTFYANRVPYDPLPSYAHLTKYVDTKYISKEAVQLVKDLMPVITPAYSIDKFYEDCVLLWKAANQQDHFISVYQGLLDRGYAENMVQRLYHTRRYAMENTFKLPKYLPGFREDNSRIREVDIPPVEQVISQGYDDWFLEKNIRLRGFTREHYRTLYENLLLTATGVNLQNTTSARGIQKAMIKLFLQLSSYSIQFVADINENDIQRVDRNYLRVGERSAVIRQTMKVDLYPVDVLDFKISQTHEMETDPRIFDNDTEVEMDWTAKVDVKLPDLMEDDQRMQYEYFYRYNIPHQDYWYDYDNYPNAWGTMPVWRTNDGLEISKEKSYLTTEVDEHDIGCSVEPPRQ